MERKCGDCALKALKGGMCPIFNANMEEENGCPYFTTEINSCDICGNLILKNACFQEDNGVFHVMCYDCTTAVPCKSCQRMSECRLQKDETCPEPLYVMVQYRQGPAIIQTQKLNPKRVEATCAQGCPCFRQEGLDDDDFCWKQNNCGCNNHKMNWRN